MDTRKTAADESLTSTPLEYVQTVTFDGPIALELGATLPSVTVAYETYGTLNDAKDNAVFVCHALSHDSHVAMHDTDDGPGWWDSGVGPGKGIDTDKYFVICSNVLGGCRGTTGPGSKNPATDLPYGNDFPTITSGDMVDVQCRLVDHLGIDELLAVIGGSMGGQAAMGWGARHPERVRGVIPIASTPRVSSQTLAFDIVGRNAIMQDPNFRDGQYYDDGPRPDVGLALARMIAHITYLSPEAMSAKFEADRYQPRDVPVVFEQEFSVGSYLGYQGTRFVDRFDANSYIRITTAIDLFDLGTTPDEIASKLTACDARWLIVSFSGDWLFPPAESRKVAQGLLGMGKRVTYCNVPSDGGHDAFLLPDEVAFYSELVRAFLANLSAGDPATSEEGIPEKSGVFTKHRLDYDRICELIEPGASVLDLGCGAGGLLMQLRQRGHERLCGVEIDDQAVLSCCRNDLDVIHGDLEKGLSIFGEDQFEYVALSRTVQTIHNVIGATDEMLRIGRRVIVTFPNFGYHKLRAMLSEQGRAPESEGVLKYRWYNSPNVRFLSILDFEEFCRDQDIRIHQQIALDTETDRDVPDDEDPNLNADLAIFVISR
jgi:homoserine O-acetyltransferase/O-succinyltransferase